MRSQDEVQRAHDLLHNIVRGEAPFTLDKDELPMCLMSLEVLCWVLRDGHSSTFTNILAKTEELLTRLGYVLEKRGTHDTGR
jgi:hypothetical protein